MHPDAVGFFEREWLVNAILWGNYSRLRDAALAELAAPPPLATPAPASAGAGASSGGGGGGVAGRLLQIACVYGDLTPRLVRRMDASARLDVVDVVPVQLANLAKKLPAGEVGRRVSLVQSDSSSLPTGDGVYDQVLLFFLLHEQPEAVRRGTLAEALRVLKPGGRVVIVEYHEPEAWHPLRPLMKQVFKRLEPYALDFWRDDVTTFLPDGYVVPPAIARNGTGGVTVRLDGSSGGGTGGVPPTEATAAAAAVGGSGTGNKLYSVSKETYFGGLYQKVVLTKAPVAAPAPAAAL